MFSINTIQEIFDGLKHNKLRTVLTGLSVSWGIFILIVLLGAGNGLKNGVTSNFSDRATNTVQMWTGTTSMTYKGLKSGRSLQFADKQLDDVDTKLVETSNQTGVITKNLTITNKGESGKYDVKGVNPSFSNIFNLKFEENGGRFINNLDNKATDKVIVIDTKIKEVLFKDSSALGKYVKVGDLMFRIIGINSKKSRFDNGTAYIPFTTAQTIFNPDLKYNNIAMSVNGLTTKESNDKFSDQLRNTMAKSLSFDQNDPQALYLRNSQADYLQTMSIFDAITIFVAVIGIFTLIDRKSTRLNSSHA